MAASSQVQLVITSEDGQAAQRIAKLVQAAREAGSALGEAGEKGRKGFKDAGEMADLLGGGIKNFVGGLAGGLTVLSTFKTLLDDVRQRSQALREEQDRSLNSAKNYFQAFGQISVNMPGASKQELSTIDTEIKRLASSTSLGEQGPVKLAGAFAQIQGAMPTAPLDAKIDALRQVANVLQISPTEDASALGLGVGKIMEGSGFSMNGTQAMNLLRQDQTLGLAKQLSNTAESIPSLASAAKLGGVGLTDMMALHAWFTQVTGDTTGEESTTNIKSMVANMMTRSTDLADKTGIPVEELGGNFFQRFATLRGRYRSGQISEAQLGDIFPDISKGGSGKMAAFEMLNEGWGNLGNYVRMMNDPAVLTGDMTGSDLATLTSVLPGMQQTLALGRQESAITAGRASRSTDAATLRAVVRNELTAMGLDAGSVEFGELNLQQGLQGGMSASRAMVNAIRSGQMGSSAGSMVRGITAPLLRLGDATLYGGAGAVQSSELEGISSPTQQIITELQKQTSELQRQNNKPPNRPLPSNLNN